MAGKNSSLKPGGPIELGWYTRPLLRNIPLTSLALNKDTMLFENSDPACDSTFYSVGLI